MESSRSSTPPWPGIRLLASFTSALRFIQDSARSPAWATAPMSSPRNACTGRARESRNRLPSNRLAATAPTSPPTAPSRVLPGLIAGASGTRPRARPTKKAAVSAENVTSSESRTHSRPWSSPRSSGPKASRPPAVQRYSHGEANVPCGHAAPGVAHLPGHVPEGRDDEYPRCLET